MQKRYPRLDVSENEIGIVWIGKSNTPSTSRPKKTPSIVQSTGQSKSWSVAESLFNAIGGFGIAVLAQVLIFPLFGLNVPLHDNVSIALCFLAVSICRSYCFRRFFNLIQNRENNG